MKQSLILGALCDLKSHAPIQAFIRTAEMVGWEVAVNSWLRMKSCIDNFTSNPVHLPTKTH